MDSTLKRIIKGGLGFFTSNVITRVLDFLFIIIASRALGAVGFGILALGLSVKNLIVKIASYGLPNTIQRFLSGGELKNNPEKLTSVFLIGILFAFIFGVLLFFSSEIISLEIFDEISLVSVLKIMAIGVFANVLYNLLTALLQAQEKINAFIKVSVFQSSLKVLLGVLAFIWIYSVESFAWALVISFVMAACFTVPYLKKISFKVALPETRELRQVFQYSTLLAITGLGYFMVQQTDRLMLGWLADASAVGFYTATSTLALVMSVLHSSLVAIFMPVASSAYRSGDRESLQEAYLFLSRWTGTLNGIVLILFLGMGTVLLGIFGADFSNETNYQILIILGVLYFIGTWVGPTGALLQMTDGHRIEFVNMVFFVLCNIVLNYIFILQMGIVGAAVATLASGLLRNIVQVIVIYMLHNIHPFNWSSSLVLGLTLSTIFIFYNEEFKVITLLITIIISCVLFFITFLSAPREELNQIKSVFLDLHK